MVLWAGVSSSGLGINGIGLDLDLGLWTPVQAWTPPLPPIHAVSLTLRISDPSSDPAPLGDPPLPPFRKLKTL